MKTWQELFNEMPDMDREQLQELRKAMMAKTLVVGGKVDKETAVALVERYELMAREKGSPLMEEEAAYAMADLMGAPAFAPEMLTTDLDTFKWRVVKQAAESFDHAIEADPKMALKLGLA